MKTKTIIQTVTAIMLLTASQAALANIGTGKANARVAGLDAAMRAMYVQAHSTIQADIRANIKATPIIIDVPGVTTGKVEIVAEAAPQAEEDTGESGAQAAARTNSREIRLDILGKALASPGLFGVYRYVTATAAKAAVIVVK